VVAVVVLAAAVALTTWALTVTTPTHSRPGTATLAPAPPASGYLSFCQNNPDLCAQPQPPARLGQPDKAQTHLGQHN
jgi:hypothetical protein